jgi:hypothetical protein
MIVFFDAQMEPEARKGRRRFSTPSDKKYFNREVQRSPETSSAAGM